MGMLSIFHYQHGFDFNDTAKSDENHIVSPSKYKSYSTYEII